MAHCEAEASVEQTPMTPRYASAFGNQQSPASTVLRSSFSESEWQSVESACARALSCSSADATRGGDVENMSPSPNYSYSPPRPQTKIDQQSPVVVAQELGTSFIRLSIDDNAADSPYPARLSLWDTEAGATDSESNTDDVETNIYRRPPSHQRRTKPGFSRKLLQGSKYGVRDVGDDSHQTSSTATRTSTGSDDFTATQSQRPYTATLGVPEQIGPTSSREPSVVSDAGQQLGLRRKKKLRASADTTNAPPVLDCSQRAVIIRSPSYEHELQEKILTSLQHTRDNQEFLPEGELCKLINPVSVAQELTKEFGRFLTPADIWSYAHQVCSEIKVSRGEKGKIKTFRKIFALLVLVGAAASIVLFLHEDVSDLDLPLHPLQPHGHIGFCRRDDHGDPTNIPLSCFQKPHWSLLRQCVEQPKWSPVELRNFQNFQWLMLAPFFSKGKHGDIMHYVLQDKHVLPFVRTNETSDTLAEKTGGFGKVSMVQIHPEHHNFPEELHCSPGFAVKQQVHVEDRETFKKEIQVLKIFSGEGRGHPHIVALLATYEQFKKLNLIFYRADGDLFAYWGTIERLPNLSYKNVLWVADQCEGLTGGLLKLHKHLTFPKVANEGTTSLSRQLSDPLVDSLNQPASPRRVKFSSVGAYEQAGPSVRATLPPITFHTDPAEIPHLKRDYGCAPERQYGRHGDINPGNILWYNDGKGDPGVLKGTLKIADFGQAELNSLKSRTKPRDVANTLTYRPPESDKLSNSPPLIRQTYDMWCLGCVFLEFVTWMLGGDELQEKFTSLRESEDFFQNFATTDTFFQVVRIAETNRLEVMVKEAVTQFIDNLHQHPRCTEYFHELLNLIQEDMLVVDSNERKTCEVVWKTLRRMRNRCHMDEEYASTTNPWCDMRASKPHSMVLEDDGLMDAQCAAKNKEVPRAEIRSPHRKKKGKHKERRKGFSPDQRLPPSRSCARVVSP